MKSQIVVAGVSAFLVLSTLAYGEQRKVDRELEGDPDRVRTPEEKRAFALLKSKGATFRWHEPRGTNPPIEPYWIAALGDSVSDADLQQLTHIKSLKSVGIGGNVTEQRVARLAELKELKELSISRITISDRAVDKIADIASLETLSLQGVTITGQGFSALAAFRSSAICRSMAVQSSMTT